MGPTYGCDPAAPRVGKVHWDSQLPSQSYYLNITNKENGNDSGNENGNNNSKPHIILTAGDKSGLRHGLATLWCLRQSGRPIAPVHISDQPSFAQRGVLLDISRYRIPTMAELTALLHSLARLKINHLQLSIEHALAYPGHATVWRLADALSLAEYQALGEQALSVGIELAGNQNCFGHAERWLTHPNYSHLGELPDVAARIASGAEEPFSLDLAQPQARDLVQQWLDTQRQCLPHSQHINIGGDETIDLGKGRSAAAVQQQGYGSVYGQRVQWLVQQAAQRDWRPMFWADIALEHPTVLPHIPPDAIALAWGYEADSDYDSWAETLADRSWWVCPGTAAWRSFGGRYDARRGSVAAALAAGRGQASGLLMTEWGDAGHRQQWPVAWLGLVEGAGAAWSGQAAQDHDAAAICWHDLGRDNGDLVTWLNHISQLDMAYRPGADHPRRGGKLINSSMPFIDLHLSTDDPWQPDLAPWQDMAAQLSDLSAKRPAIANDLVAAECDHTASQLTWAVQRACLRRSWHDSAARQRWSQAGEALIAEHCRLWLQRCRGGGLIDSCRWYRAAQQEWLTS